MKTVQEFVGCLFEIELTAHVAHWQTRSFAQHSALGELYDAMPELRDKYVEAYQGQYGIISNHTKTISVQEGKDMVSYLKEEIEEISSYRETLKDGYLQQMVDNVLEQLNTSLYKLKFLK